MLLFIPPNENAQCFGIFKSKRGANLCSHMAQWGVVNKKSNVSAISSYIYIYIDIDFVSTIFLCKFMHLKLENIKRLDFSYYISI